MLLVASLAGWGSVFGDVFLLMFGAKIVSF